MKKLVLFGDSLFGNFGKHLIVNLESALPEYDVYNCAAGGWDTNDCVNKAPYIAQLKSDVVVISLGTNDACPWKQVPLETFKENLPKIFQTFSGSRIIFWLPPPVVEERLEGKRAQLTNEIMKQYADAARQICESNTIEHIDSWELYKDPEANKRYHVEDGTHITDEGYDVIIKELASILNK